jgi:uncharacterized protein YndB with AHSA1/START domain
MENKQTFSNSIVIHASTSKVWDALTNPAIIKQYLFGTDTITDWQQGSDIVYTGEWQGQTYRDKGKVVAIIPEKLLHTTYFSFMSGKEDKPENYANVVYELEPQGEYTVLKLSQDNVDDATHAADNWNLVMGKMKQILEQKQQ